MNKKDVMDKLMCYEEHEIFYRNYYLNKQKDSFPLFLSNLNPEKLYSDRLIVPEINGSWNPTKISENMIDSEDVKKEIVLLKHYRYTPVFDHIHSFFELTYCISGSCTQIIEVENVQLKEGQFCLIPPGTSHNICVFDDSIIINIIIWKKNFEDIFYNLLRQTNIVSNFLNGALYLDSLNNYMVVDTKNDSNIKDLVLEMYGQFLEQKKYYNIVNNAQILYLFSIIIQSYEDNISFSNKAIQNNPIIIHMISYIERNFKTISLIDLAKHFNYSPKHCSRMIKKYTNLSFTDLVLNIKFTKIKNSMKSSDKPIYRIAEENGFNNIEHFNRLFKKRFNLTPNEYKMLEFTDIKQ